MARIIAFCCENSGWLAYQSARPNLSSQLKVKAIKLPCSGRLDVLYLYKSLAAADGVMVLACQKENCKFLRGNNRAEQRWQGVAKMLASMGVNAERIAFVNLAANMGPQLAEEILAFAQRLAALGDKPGKVVNK
ncbi:MAG: hydrogenase iron-sulfur subunit [Bacillota bacterium]